MVIHDLQAALDVLFYLLLFVRDADALYVYLCEMVDGVIGYLCIYIMLLLSFSSTYVSLIF